MQILKQPPVKALGGKVRARSFSRPVFHLSKTNMMINTQRMTRVAVQESEHCMDARPHRGTIAGLAERRGTSAVIPALVGFIPLAIPLSDIYNNYQCRGWHRWFEEASSTVPNSTIMHILVYAGKSCRKHQAHSPVPAAAMYVSGYNTLQQVEARSTLIGASEPRKMWFKFTPGRTTDVQR